MYIYNLSIYLLKKRNIKASLDDYIKPKYINGEKKDELSKHFIDKDYLEGSENIQGKIYIYKEDKGVLSWAPIVNQLAQSKKKIIKDRPGSIKALILFKIRSRVVALSFSHGKTLIKDGYLETDFGIKTSRKVIDKEQVKSIKSVSVNEGVISNHKYARKSIPTHLQLDNSTLNIVHDIKGQVQEHIITEENKEVKITTGGRDQVQLKITGGSNFLSKIVTMLEKIIEIYLDKEEYADNFYWSNEIRKENNPKVIEKLDEKLADKIRLMINRMHLEDPSKRKITGSTLIDIEIHPDVPYSEENPITGFSISGIGYKSDYVHPDIDDINIFSSLAKFLQKKEETSGEKYSAKTIIDKLKRDKVYCYQEEEEIYLSNFYSSIYFQTALPNDKESRYVLLKGKWYGIPKDIYNYIADTINNIPDDRLGIDYITFTSNHSRTTKGGKVQRSEGEYNKDMSKRRNLTLFDQRDYLIPKEKIREYNLVPQSSVEPCDLLSHKKEPLQLIHVKRGRSGSGLSHLLTQAYASSVLYKSDPGFLNHLNKITAEQGSSIVFEYLKEKPVVVLACIVDPKYLEEKNSKTFPFLSAVRIVETVNKIKDLGFACHLIKIPDKYK